MVKWSVKKDNRGQKQPGSKLRFWGWYVKLRNEMRKEEIMDAVIKSEHSYAEIMAFIKGEDVE